MLLYSRMQKKPCRLHPINTTKKQEAEASSGFRFLLFHVELCHPHHLHELVVSVDSVLHKRSHALETSLLVGPDCSLIKGEHKEAFASPLLLDMRQHAFGEGSQSIDIIQVKPLQHQLFHTRCLVFFYLLDNHVSGANDLVISRG